MTDTPAPQKPTSLKAFKRLANKMKKFSQTDPNGAVLKHGQALDAVAREWGWKDYHEAHKDLEGTDDRKSKITRPRQQNRPEPAPGSEK